MPYDFTQEMSYPKLLNLVWPNKKAWALSSSSSLISAIQDHSIRSWWRNNSTKRSAAIPKSFRRREMLQSHQSRLAKRHIDATMRRGETWSFSDDNADRAHEMDMKQAKCKPATCLGADLPWTNAHQPFSTSV